MEYSQEYDESKTFFEQIKSLQERIPRPHQAGLNNQNCDWSDDIWNSKNCYLSRSSEECEDLTYSYRTFKCKNSINLVFSFEVENSYDCVYCFNSYNLKYSINSRNCIDSYFLYDCRNCTNCFMSWNLRNKSYCIENIQYTKEKYFEKLKEYNLLSRVEVKSLKEVFEIHIKKDAIHRENYNIQTKNSTGDFLYQTNNCQSCFSFSESEDLHNSVRGIKGVSSSDVNGCWYIENSCNSFGCVNAYGLKSCLSSPSRYSEYLDICEDCEYCFGCIGLKKKKYCILNKQYTKEEYETLKEKIINDMKKNNEYGNYFPYNMSLIPYNLSTSSLYINRTKEEIERLGGYWFLGDLKQADGFNTNKIPDINLNVDKNISKKPFICKNSGFRFNLSERELEFYDRWGIPLPDTHFDFRIKNKMELLSSISSFKTNCFLCDKNINVSYKPKWGYKKIYCEDCYKQEII
jgi:hypothetical protein